MEFTFGIVTYNVDLYILDLLESIRFQIETYGNKDIVNYLVVSDDCSTDNTLDIVKIWIKKYKNLFKECKIIKTEKNSGVVFNYSNLIRNIKTDYMRTIAGDDIISFNNIYESIKCVDNGNLNVYSTIRFNDYKTYAEETDYVDMFYYSNFKHTHKKDIYLMETTKPFATPEVCLNRKYFTEDCLNNISNYRMFEDDPIHLYILRNNKDMILEYINKPMVLYRMHDKSLSRGVVGSTQIMFWDDLYKFKKYIFKTTKTIKGKLFAMSAVWATFLQKHRFSIDHTLFLKLIRKSNDKKKNYALNNLDFNLFKEKYDKMIKGEQKHLNKIAKEAKSFKENYIDKEGK